MALLDDLDGVDSNMRAWVSDIERALAFDGQANAGYFDHYAYDLDLDPELSIGSQTTPPLGVHAVGAIATEAGWVPGMLVMRGLAPGSTLQRASAASSYASLADFLIAMGRIDPGQVGVIEIDPPQSQYATVHGDLWGTLGLPVRFVDGSVGALTAGHVAKKKGNAVTVDDAIAGEVVFSDHRGNYRAPQPCADVAAIRLPYGWQHRVDLPDGLHLGEVHELHTLEALNRSGTGAGGQIVRFAGDTFKVSEVEGAWGNFAMADPISVEGDSGALVLAEDGGIAGQVAGGLDGAYSIAQMIRYLTSAADVTPDF